MGNKVVTLSVAAMALLPLIFIMPTTTGASPQLYTNPPPFGSPHTSSDPPKDKIGSPNAQDPYAGTTYEPPHPKCKNL